MELKGSSRRLLNSFSNLRFHNYDIWPIKIHAGEFLQNDDVGFLSFIFSDVESFQAFFVKSSILSFNYNLFILSPIPENPSVP